MLQVDAASCSSPQAGWDSSMSMGGGEGTAGAGRHGAAVQSHSQTPEMMFRHGAQSYPHTPQMMFLSPAPAQRPHTVGGNMEGIGKKLLFFNEGAQDVVDAPITPLNAALHPPHPAGAAFRGGLGSEGEKHVEDGEEEGVGGGEGGRDSKGEHLKPVGGHAPIPPLDAALHSPHPAGAAFRGGLGSEGETHVEDGKEEGVGGGEGGRESNGGHLKPVGGHLKLVFRHSFVRQNVLHDDFISPGCVCLCVCSCVRACVRACVLVCEKDRESEREKERESESERERVQQRV